jgi:hypothetical protein
MNVSEATDSSFVYLPKFSARLKSFSLFILSNVSLLTLGVL